MTKMYQISTPTWVGGIIVRDGKVRHTAPIAAWMRGKTVPEIKAYVDSKRGWSIAEVTSE